MFDFSQLNTDYELLDIDLYRVSFTISGYFNYDNDYKEIITNFMESKNYKFNHITCYKYYPGTLSEVHQQICEDFRVFPGNMQIFLCKVKKVKQNTIEDISSSNKYFDLNNMCIKGLEDILYLKGMQIIINPETKEHRDMYRAEYNCAKQ